MGKVLEAIGKIDGYDIIEIGKNKLKKEDLFKEIVNYDSNIKDYTRRIVGKSSGVVFAVVKKGIIKGMYIFEIESKGDINKLKHIKTVYTNEVSQSVREKYDNHIMDILKDSVSMKEYENVAFNDSIIQIDPRKTKTERAIAIIGGFAIGFIMGWIIFDEFYMGIIYGVILGPVFSDLEVVVNKKSRSKDKNITKKD